MKIVTSQLSGEGWVFLAGEAHKKHPTPLLFEMILKIPIPLHGRT
jgi:hypothetical protein